MHPFSFIILPIVLYANLILAIPLESRGEDGTYSGAGGPAYGGSSNSAGGLLNIFSSE